MFANLADELPDGAFRIVCAATPEEERGVLFPERVEPPVGADGRSCCFRWSLPAVDCRQKMLEHVLKIGEIDGSFVDSHELGKSYGTGMALMVLKNSVNRPE